MRHAILPQQPPGFTFIELVVTVTIVGILASVALPLVELEHRRHQEETLRHALEEIREALDAYHHKVEEGHIALNAKTLTGYPASLDVLVKGVPDARDPNGRKLYFLRRVPRDPFFTDPTVPAADTWALRSYASPPDDPQPGDDVYDVHSKSDQAGLNGVPYEQW